MAIDTKSLTDIITEFRALQSKDAVSPESLGYILQRIVDLLATAGTSETVSNITKLLDGFKAAGQAITALSQGQADRNHIYANKSTVNLATGAVSASSELFIQQATTERAGAMRAQQVIDLNSAKKSISELEKLLSAVQSEIAGRPSVCHRSTKAPSGRLRSIPVPSHSETKSLRRERVLASRHKEILSPTQGLEPVRFLLYSQG